MFLSFIILCSAALIPPPLMSETRRWSIAVLWAEINIAALKMICGLGYIVKAEEKIPPHKCVVFFKHSSVMEAFVGLKHFSPSYWVAKY